jgi:hypothetical protein
MRAPGEIASRNLTPPQFPHSSHFSDQMVARPLELFSAQWTQEATTKNRENGAACRFNRRKASSSCLRSRSFSATNFSTCLRIDSFCCGGTRSP